MKIATIFSILFLLFSCTNKKNNADKNDLTFLPKKHISTKIQTAIDSANLNGAVLIYDLQQQVYYSNDFDWNEKGHLPASTFKIPNSIIALETGVVKNEETLFKWDGKERALKTWERDLVFKEAFRLSCVPCYQEVARKIGLKRMREYLDILDYKEITLDSSSIDNFWLVGNSKISQFQQIEFLIRLYRSQLNIAPRTEQIIKEMMILERHEDYLLSGKTGWSIQDGENNGWFVGFLETNSKVFFFASNVEPGMGFDMKQFASVRKNLTMDIFRKMQIIDSKS